MGLSILLRSSVVVAAVLAAGAGLRPETAEAQVRRGPERGWQQTSEYDRGYRQGLVEGQRDARRNLPYSAQRDPRFGARDDFRRGFADGYRAGFDRGQGRGVRPFLNNGGLGRRPPVTRNQEPAAARGFSDGYARGLSDGGDGDRYDPVGERDYRDADNGYFKGYGARDAYRTNYRSGFRAGYEEGYRDGQRYER